MILDTFHWIRINIPQYIVGAKREIGQNNDLPASVWFHDQTSLLKLSENLERLFQQVSNLVEESSRNVNKYYSACKWRWQNVYRMTWMPPSLLQFSMYLVTSWASKLFAVEGNKPIWPPNWGPDGWLSLFPILSSFVTLQSNSHGNTIPSWRSTQHHDLSVQLHGFNWVFMGPDETLLKKETLVLKLL